MSGSRMNRDLLRRLSAALGAETVAWVEGDGTPSSLRVEAPDREGFHVAAAILLEKLAPWRPVGLAKAEPGRCAVSTVAFDGILDFWPRDLVARIGAGARLGDLQALLAEQGLRVPVTSLRPGEHTLGGLFASGERGWRGGPNHRLRESVLGLTVIDGGGRVLKGGGRVMKNVAGWDLVHLHHGAGGALGVITDLTIKLEARPQAASAFALPVGVEEVATLLDATRLPAAAAEPVVQLWLDETAAARAGFEGGGLLVVAAEGWREAVDHWASALPQGAVAVDPAELLRRACEGAFWSGRLHLGPSAVLDVWPSWSRKWKLVEPSLVLDLQTGHARVLLHREAPLRNAALIELAKAGRAVGGRLYAETEEVAIAGDAAPPDGPSSSEDPAWAIARRLKVAFDPGNLLPPLPRPVGGWR